MQVGRLFYCPYCFTCPVLRGRVRCPHLCPMITANKNGRPFNFSDNIWEAMSAAQKAEFTDVGTLVRPAPRAAAKQVIVPPEVLAVKAKHKQAAEEAGPSDEHGVIGRDQHDDDDQPREVGGGIKVAKSKSKTKK